MKRGQGKGALLAGAFGAAVLGAGVLVLAPPAGAAPGQSRVALPQAVPALPAGAQDLGAAPSGQVLDLDVVLAGQDPGGLAQAVAAVSTPGSPDYRHYLSAAQYAAEFGPSATEVAQASEDLRAEGLTVGTPDPGSNLLPVRGTAAVVSAAFGTPLESVQAPQQAARAIVNTATPQVPAALSGVVTGVVGLDGLFHEHAMLVQAHTAHTAQPGGAQGNGASPSPAAGVGPADVARAGTPQACPAAAGQAFGGAYTSTQMSSIFGLDQLFAQGRTGVGQSIAVVEFEQYLQSDFETFEQCYGLSNPIRNVVVDGPVGGQGGAQGQGEAALDTELAAVNAPSAALVVYEAPNNNDVAAMDLYNKIASDDSSQVVTTSWGNCEALAAGDIQWENQVFSRMALQGQTVIAAAGDAGSEDCYPVNGSTALAVDDPGSQPDVVSAGGTAMTGASASSQVVWNDCYNYLSHANVPGCASSTTGAGGGGYSIEWPANPGQPSSGPACTRGGGSCRAVPDIAYPADPSDGAVVAYSSAQGGWTAFGGTSVAAPTNAGLFADTNQGCFGQLGRVGPALYAAAGDGSTFTDITSANNDYTDTYGGADFPAGPGYNLASGLGTPVDQNLSIALQGADGCPSVASVSPNTGPVSGGGAITVTGGGFANATSVTFGSVGAGQIVSQTPTSITVVPPGAGGPRCVDITVANSQGISAKSPADQYGYGGDLNCGQGYRFVASDGGVFDFGDATFWGSTGGIHLNEPVVGMAVTPSTNGYWLVASDGGIFTFGDARLLRLHGRPASQPTDRGHGLDRRRRGVLAGGGRRRHLQLRRRRVLRVDGRHAPQQTDRGHGGDPRRRRLLAGRLRRRHLLLRRRALPRLGGRAGAELAGRGHGGLARRRGLLAGGGRRRDLRLRRRRLLRLRRRPAPQQARGGHGGHPRRLAATGWWRPTAGSSPTATRASTGRRGASS